MKKIIILCIFLFDYYSINAQDWQWSKSLGCNGINDNDYAELRSFNNNDILLYIQSNSGNNKFFINSDTLNVNNGNIFIAKLDNSGNTIWLKQIISPVMNCFYIHDLIINKTDNSFYLYGAYCSSMSSICGSPYGSGNNSSMYISKYDSNGDCIWAKKIDSLSLDIASSCAIDDSGNLYVASEHWNSVNYDSINVVAGTVISKFDLNGNCLWVKNISPLTNDGNPRPGLEIRSLCYKNGFLYINAYGNSDTVLIDSNVINNPGQRGALVAKLTADADLVWYKEGLGYNPQAGRDALGVDGNGNVYASGAFQDSINFEGNILYGGPQPFPVGYNFETYLVKYDSVGTLIWVKQFHSGQSGIVRSVTNDNGLTYLTSTFNDSIEIDNYHLYPSATQDMYLTRFSSNGNCLGIKHFGDAVSINFDIDNNGDAVVISQIKSTATVDQNVYTSTGNFDLILSKCSEITGIETVEKTRNNDLLIYANPTNGKCSITIPDEFKNKNSTLTLILYDNNGKIIRSYPVRMKDGAIKLNLEYEAAGIYLVTLSDGQKVYRGKDCV